MPPAVAALILLPLARMIVELAAASTAATAVPVELIVEELNIADPAPPNRIAPLAPELMVVTADAAFFVVTIEEPPKAWSAAKLAVVWVIVVPSIRAEEAPWSMIWPQLFWLLTSVDVPAPPMFAAKEVRLLPSAKKTPKPGQTPPLFPLPPIPTVPLPSGLPRRTLEP